MSDNKTLSTVKPGGKVMLGDQAERVRFEAWAIKYGHDLARRPIGREGEDSYICEHTHYAWAAWQAALAAQPSRGGHFDLEAMLTACIPGGSIVDPQLIADNIRQWIAQQPSPAGQGDADEDAYVIDRLAVGNG